MKEIKIKTLKSLRKKEKILYKSLDKRRKLKIFKKWMKSSLKLFEYL